MRKYLLVIFAIVSFSQCEKEFDPEGYGSFTDDRDGRAYKTVIIGEQIWMAENMKYLPEVSSPVKTSDSIEYYYVYDYYGIRVDRAEETTDYKTFGVLYNHPAAMEVCPAGWHLPDRKDWKDLTNTIGQGNGSDMRSVEYWASNDKGNNKTGFNALPAGCQEGGIFRKLGSKAAFWSAEVPYAEPGSAFIWGFLNSLDKIDNMNVSKTQGYPVRCVKDTR